MSDTDFPRPPAPASQTAPENRLYRRLLQGVVAAAVAGTAAFFGWTRVLFPARPHRLLLGRVADFAFLRPCHQGRYDASGKVIGGPPPLPLASLPHHAAGDKLFLNS